MTSSIDSELVRSFENASAALIESIREALRNFRATSPDNQAAWESRSTPSDWETRVLSNLQKYHDHLKIALPEYRAGDITRITRVAGTYKGLSKHLDGYALDWATEHNRLAVDAAVDRVVELADQIHRLGNAELTRMGR
jgi:hypothetical protein